MLVVDTSGSMDNGDGDSMGYAYTETYNVRNNSRTEYYVQDDGEWHEVSYSRDRGWYYNAGSFRDPDYRTFTPKTSADDGNPDHTQFYTREQVNKMEALQSAANTFIDSVAAMNDSIADTSKQHRISLVKFASDENDRIGNSLTNSGYNCSQVVSDLSAYTTNNASSLKNTINSLYGEGATQADYGLHQAQRVLNGEGSLTGAREGAQKVVIFFTDGEPSTFSNWSDEVASDAVEYARDMKADGTLIYSIGVVQGADPSDDPTSDRTSNINKFLHAVSSNYKNATYEYERDWFGGSYNWSFGDRTTGAQGEPNPDYYFAATDADELDQVFENITSSITENAGSGSPIIDNSTEGNMDPGDLTFTDQLGSYMQVTGTDAGSDKIQLAYGDQIYTSASKTTEGNVDTYHFEGKVDGNAVYGAADLADLTVTVTRSSDLATGDTVTVTIPASLIPLRNYDVDTDNNTMTVSQAYPVRLFYGVSLKDGVMNALNDPSSAEYAAIIGSQASADKTTLDFYSNSFIKNAADGSATAEFTPNEGNKFYYYTSNTQLFLDEACSQPATRYNSQVQNTLYYKDVYWTLTGNGNEAREVTEGYGTVTRDGSEWDAINWGNGQTQAFIPAHTERTDRPAAMTDAKDNNVTGTAANVLNPAWVGGSVEQRLGNNGKLSLPMPGSFEIKKTVDWGNASDQTKQDKNSFTFEVSLTDAEGTALTGSYPYYINGSDESAGKVSNGGTITITGGQSVEVKGLPAGAQFTVTEQGANQNGFTTIDSTSQEGQQNTENDGTVSGTIAAGMQISVSFTNTYHAQDVNLSTNTTLKVQKNLEGRDWRDTDSFEFTIIGFRGPEGVTPVPMPENAVVTVDADDVDNNYTASFGDITFSVPGEYRYTIQENGDPQQPVAGINYSDAIYRVTVMVGDNGTGALTIGSVKIERMYNDDGTLVNTENEGEIVTGDTMAFKNTYSADNDTEGIQGKKSYNDTTGGNPFEGGKFTFKLEAQGGFVTDGGSADKLTISADDTPMPDGAQNNAITTGNVGEDFTFPSITFDGDNAGSTYVYKVTEVAGNEDGMTYSSAEHTVMIKVEEVTDAEGTHIVATVLGDYADPNKLVFENTYDPEDAQLTKDAGTAIHGTKTLTGRGMKDGETFYFQLTQTSGPETILDKAEVAAVTKDTMQGGSADFSFEDMTFSKTGTYTFTVNETADENGTETADGSGMTYDTNIATVTVTVTDGNKSDNPEDHGKLLAAVAYSNDKHSDTTDKALFTNTYEASMNYGALGAGGIKVTKELTNRPMANDEFAFSIAGTDSADVTADGANAKLSDADKNFKNTGAAADTAITMDKLQNMSFDQTDAGRTYSYIVDEADADALPGVNFDQTQYRVDIQVVDNGDGTMHTLTTVTRVKNAAGEDVNETVIDAANSDADDYAVPTFGFVNEYNPTPAEAGEGTDHAIQVTKTVTGAPSPDGVSYSFTLTAAGDNIGNITGLDENNQLHVSTSGIINAGESQTLDFSKLTFSKPGTYTFTVQEDEPAPADGWIYDTAAKTVTVVVTGLNGQGQYDGKLYIQSVTGSPVEVTNSYEPGSVVVGGEGADQQITVQKSVTGADSTADFQFKIEPVNGEDPKWDNVEAVDENFDALTSITGGVTQAQSRTAAFAGIKFNAAGEYQFKITEVGASEFNAGDSRGGWTYDEHEAFVTVTVTDDNFDGQLDAAVSYDNTGATADADKAVDNAAAFTNKYEAESATLTGSADFKGTKTIEGRNGLEGETFEFQLAKGDVSEGGSWDAVTFQPTNGDAAEFATAGAAATMHKDGNSANFWFDGTFTFSQAGIYIFNVTETGHNGSDLPADGTNGMTYDRHIGTITVTVTDDGQGRLHAAAAAGEDGASMTFVNKYAAEPARWGYAASQLLGGHKYINDTTGNTYTLEAGQFSFTMRAQAAGNPMPEGWDANAEGAVDDQGRGMMTVTNGTGSASDISIYDFGWIEFTHEDMAGAAETEGQPGVYTKTFQYNIFETGTMPAGISRDNTAYTVTFTVTEDYNTGKITVAAPTATKIVEGSGSTGDPADAAKLDFTNTYNPATIDGHQNFFKTLNGRNWQQGDTFTFNVSMTAAQTDGSDWPEGAPLPSVQASDGYEFSEVVNNDAGNGFGYTVTINPSSQTGNTYRFDAGTITYEREGIYTWTISEQESEVPGVTSDPTVYTVKVTVTDENGVLKRSVELTGGQYSQHEGDQTLDFTNTYTTSGTLESDGEEAIKVTKNFTGRENDAWLEGDSFTALLTAQDSIVDGSTLSAGQVPMPDGRTGGTASIRLTADAHESLPFGDIVYTRPGTYHYTLTEVQEQALEGVEYSKAAYNVTVTAADNGDGTMTVTSAIQQVRDDDGSTFSPLKDVEEAVFANTYHAGAASLEGSTNLRVVKNLEGRGWFSTDHWTFTLEPADEATKAAVEETQTVIMPAPSRLTITGDTENHAASFGSITFTEPGTYTFTVKEEGAAAGVENDPRAERTIVVKVTDDTKGSLTAETVSQDSDDLIFTNTYRPEEVTIGGDADDAVTVQKTLLGHEWADGEEYSFTIAPAEGYEDAPMPEDDTITVGRPADGNVSTAQFGEMTFAETGTYVYEITENKPADADETMTYDAHTAQVIIAVTENQTEGRLEARVMYDNSGAINQNDQNTAQAAAFTNTQTLETTLELTGTKTLEGREFQAGDSFTFTVTAEDNAPLPDGVDETGNITITPDQGSSAAVDFGTITFDKEGEYIYHLTEQAGNAAGMEYDTARRDIIVTVTNDGAGNLNASVTSGADQLTWTNSWTFQPGGAFSLDGTKVMRGSKLTDSQFTFLVEPLNDAPMGDTLPANFNGAAAANEDGSYTAPITLLNNIVYTAEGDYSYLISEVNDGQQGVVYDGAVYKVTVHVARDGSISKTIEKSVDGQQTWTEADKIEFSNSYSVSEAALLDGSVNLSGFKILEGRDWNSADSFTFLLEAADGQTQAAVDAGTVILPAAMETIQGAYSEGAEVPFQFGDIIFNKAGTYRFTISEQQPGSEGFVGETGGMTYDSHVRAIEVTVADNGRGALAASVTKTEGENRWINSYDAADGMLEDGDANLTVTKVLQGRDWNDSDKYKFTLAPADEKTEQAVADKAIVLSGDKAEITGSTPDHRASFGKITFKTEGTYSFQIKEVKGDIANVSYDGHTVTVNVTVTDNQKGQLVAVSENIAGSLTFTNTYTPDPVTASVAAVKAMEGRELKPDDKFEFTISAAEDSPAGTPLPDVTTVTNNEDGTIKFAPMTYTEAGTYRYYIAETGGQVPGVTNSTEVVTAVVTVTYDPAAGVLTPAVSYENGNTITNVYHADPTEVGAVPDFTAKKTVTASENNSYTMQGGEFAFTITQAAQNPESDPVKTQTVSNDADGNVVFMKDVVYTEPGTYIYTVTEKNSGAAGITYDDSEYVITVKVDDPGDGQLTASYSLTKDGEEADAVTFENTYNPEAVTVNLNGIKNLSGKDLEEGEFRFRLEGVNASVPAPAPTETSEAVLTPEATPEAVPEATPETTPEATPETTPEAETDLEATPEPEMTPEAENTETREDGEVLTGFRSGSLLGKLLDGVISSRLVNTLPPMPAESVVSNNAAGYFQFGNITYTAPGTYTYRITEINDGEEGVSYDGTVYNVTVQVTDENGVLKAETAVTAGGGTGTEGIVFNNSYQAAPVTLTGETAIRGTKNLEGRGMEEGEFSFELIDADNQVVGTAVNSADGSFVFGDLTFDREGTYLYTMREVPAGLGGITYDTNTYAVRITVTDAGGHLEAAVEYFSDGQAAEGAVFTNTYQASGTSVQLSVTKVLSGRTLEAGEFTFQVKDADGQVVAEAVNDADGVVRFPEIAYDEAGTYSYTITEVKGSAAHVTYDETVYRVTVTVTDNLEGSLEAQIDFEQEGCPVFQNIYTEPTPEPTEEPTQTPTKAPAKTPSQGKTAGAADTGDSTDNTPYAAGGLAGAAVLAALIAVAAVRRKRSK